MAVRDDINRMVAELKAALDANAHRPFDGPVAMKATVIIRDSLTRLIDEALAADEFHQEILVAQVYGFVEVRDGR